MGGFLPQHLKIGISPLMQFLKIIEVSGTHYIREPIFFITFVRGAVARSHKSFLLALNENSTN